jgi:hypothetical protein
MIFLCACGESRVKTIAVYVGVPNVLYPCCASGYLQFASLMRTQVAESCKCDNVCVIDTA